MIHAIFIEHSSCLCYLALTWVAEQVVQDRGISWAEAEGLLSAAVEDHKQFNDLVADRLRENISKPSIWKKYKAPNKMGFFWNSGEVVLLIEKIPCYAVSAKRVIS